MSSMEGKKFGRLTVIRRNGYLSNGKTRLKAYLCRCECGNTNRVRGSLLRRGKVKSCGCLAVDAVVERCTSHGLSGTKLYWVWEHMVRRGTGAENKRFYKDRGIFVCDEWMKFENFLKWADGKYAEHLTLDRIDTTDGYYPGNCRFVSYEENEQNTTRSMYWVVYGKIYNSCGDAARKMNCSPSYIRRLCVGRFTDRYQYKPEPFCYTVKKYKHA